MPPSSSDPTWILQELDALGCVLSIEGDVEAVFGRAGDELVGQTVLHVIHPADHEASLEMWTSLLGEPGGTRSIRQRVVRADGSVRWIESTVMNRLGADGTGVMLTVSHDITERRRHERDLHARALEDALTGLPNRRALVDGLATALEEGPTVVAFVDLDGFKQVNDELGHHVGDEVLIALGLRLHNEVSPVGMAGRWGGDEFVVITPGEDDSTLRAVIERAFDHPISCAGTIWHPRGSYGTATGHPGDEPAELIRSADTAMYQAKERRPRD